MTVGIRFAPPKNSSCLLRCFFLSLEYKNPVEIQECSKHGNPKLEALGGCELLRKNAKVKECTLCHYDHCNHTSAIHRKSLDQLILVFIGCFMILIFQRWFVTPETTCVSHMMDESRGLLSLSQFRYFYLSYLDVFKDLTFRVIEFIR